MITRPFLCLFPLLVVLPTLRAEPVHLARDAALSPDGKTLAFAWRGDLWRVPTTGGRAQQLTQHTAEESAPAFSPDGKQLAFVSNREGSNQIYLMPATGGEARQVSFHTEGYDLREWSPDGQSLLVSLTRDFSWMRAPRSSRLALLDLRERRADTLLFDDYGYESAFSADGQRLLLVREGEVWWRQGYQGSRAGQIWLFDRQAQSFQSLLTEPTECRWPLWKPDGSGFYYVSNRDGTYNLYERAFDGQQPVQKTHFKGDSVVFPTLSAMARPWSSATALISIAGSPAKAANPKKSSFRPIPTLPLPPSSAPSSAAPPPSATVRTACKWPSSLGETCG
jgi:tricorn protease